MDAALELYKSMDKVYGVMPDAIHATIIVDILSRSGQLQEAVYFIKKNIPEPSIFIGSNFPCFLAYDIIYDYVYTL